MQCNSDNAMRVRTSRLDYREVPGLWAQLETRPEIAARVLQLVILTACRPTEVVNARWQDFDWRYQVWTIPAADTKSGRVQRIPLFTATGSVLAGLFGLDAERVLPPDWRVGSRFAWRLCVLLRRMGYEAIVPHDFRLCFHEWAVAQRRYSRGVIGRALGHTDTSAASRNPQAWADLRRRHRQLLQAWTVYCFSESPLAHLADV